MKRIVAILVGGVLLVGAVACSEQLPAVDASTQPSTAATKSSTNVDPYSKIDESEFVTQWLKAHPDKNEADAVPNAYMWEDDVCKNPSSTQYTWGLGGGKEVQDHYVLVARFKCQEFAKVWGELDLAGPK